jgi:hypothetical protein
MVMLYGFKRSFEVGDKVSVPSQNYTGEIIDKRENPDGSSDYHVRYSIPGGRRPFYETWWPVEYLFKLDAFGGDK